MLKNRYRKLIISPHADDEILGCGGILDKKSFVYYCGLDESQINLHDPKHRIGIEKRKKEIQKVANFFGFKWKFNPNSKVNHYTERDFIGIFERLINLIKPDIIYLPFPSYNQDHREIYNAAQIALRPHDKNFFVKKVVLYEQPHSIFWEQKEFKVNYFIPIDINKKIKGYKLHKSQIRKMRSPEMLKAIAKIRGAQANCEYAEAFKIGRWVK